MYQLFITVILNHDGTQETQKTQETQEAQGSIFYGACLASLASFAPLAFK